jgi:polyisoprenoid-binding protein YceI
MKKVPTIGFDAKVTLKRSEFGMGNYVPNVSDDIKIQITTEASVAKPAAK